MFQRYELGADEIPEGELPCEWQDDDREIKFAGGVIVLDEIDEPCSEGDKRYCDEDGWNHHRCCIPQGVRRKSKKTGNVLEKLRGR